MDIGKMGGKLRLTGHGARRHTGSIGIRARIHSFGTGINTPDIHRDVIQVKIPGGITVLRIDAGSHDIRLVLIGFLRSDHAIAFPASGRDRHMGNVQFALPTVNPAYNTGGHSIRSAICKLNVFFKFNGNV